MYIQHRYYTDVYLNIYIPNQTTHETTKLTNNKKRRLLLTVNNLRPNDATKDGKKIRHNKYSEFNIKCKSKY